MKYLLILVVLLAACAEVQTGSRQAFENANSVIQSGSGKVWIPKKEPAKAQDEQEENL